MYLFFFFPFLLPSAALFFVKMYALESKCKPYSETFSSVLKDREKVNTRLGKVILMLNVLHDIRHYIDKVTEVPAFIKESVRWD